jgi:hypothetical protein
VSLLIYELSEDLPSVLPSPLLDGKVPLLLVVAQKLKVPPVLERTRAIARQQKEYRHPNVGYKVHRQQYDELGNLAEREGRVHRRACRLAQSADGVVQRIFGDGSVFADEVFVAFVDEDSVENVDLGLVLRRVSICE